MRSLLPRRLTRAVLALAAVLWGWSFSAQQLHQATVVHVVCPEHGVVTELTGGGDPHPVETIGALPEGEHHDGCALPAVAPGAPALPPPPPVLVAEAPVALPIPQPVLSDTRRPPLAYAPKTSPPV